MRIGVHRADAVVRGPAREQNAPRRESTPTEAATTRARGSRCKTPRPRRGPCACAISTACPRTPRAAGIGRNRTRSSAAGESRTSPARRRRRPRRGTPRACARRGAPCRRARTTRGGPRRRERRRGRSPASPRPPPWTRTRTRRRRRPRPPRGDRERRRGAFFPRRWRATDNARRRRRRRRRRATVPPRVEARDGTARGSSRRRACDVVRESRPRAGRCARATRRSSLPVIDHSLDYHRSRLVGSLDARRKFIHSVARAAAASRGRRCPRPDRKMGTCPSPRAT